MQFISAKPLIEKFRERTFRDNEVAPYFIVQTLVVAFTNYLAFGDDPTGWDFGLAVSAVIITLWGIFHLRKKNGGAFENGFLNKWFALGWVVGIRIGLGAIPIFVALFAFSEFMGGEGAMDAAWYIISILFEIAFFLILGRLFSLSQPLPLITDH
ncbi:MAG: hypothetical protein V4733_02685 [Verrucomicrobiota bacterium]